MSIGFSRFDKSVQKANGWLKELEDDLRIDSRDHSYTLLRAVLHTLRDRLPLVEIVQLGGQLPTLIRGIYYDGWTLNERPGRLNSMDEFVRTVLEAMAPTMPRHPKMEVEGVLALLGRHVSAGEIADVQRCLPETLRAQWPQPTLTS